VQIFLGSVLYSAQIFVSFISTKIRRVLNILQLSVCDSGSDSEQWRCHGSECGPQSPREGRS